MNKKSPQSFKFAKNNKKKGLTMKKYIGTKEVKATPMTRADAELHLGRNVGGDIHGEGYLVEYENNYQAWSPKDVFDKSYFQILNDSKILEEPKPHEFRVLEEADELQDKLGELEIFLTPHEFRVLEEADELQDKLGKLEIFLTTDFFKTLSEESQILLKAQAVCMTQYNSILNHRINLM